MRNWKIIARISLSLFFSILAGNIVAVPLLLIVSALNLSNMIKGLIVVIGIGLYFFVIIVSFKKIYSYSKTEILKDSDY